MEIDYTILSEQQLRDLCGGFETDAALEKLARMFEAKPEEFAALPVLQRMRAGHYLHNRSAFRELHRREVAARAVKY